MPSYNKVILMGNLTRDPDLRRTPSGSAVCDVRIAVSEFFRDKNGERVERTVFIDVSTWGQQAESCGKYLRKGMPVFVEGRLQYDEWKTPQGESRSKIRVVASRVQFMAPIVHTKQDGENVPGPDMTEFNSSDADEADELPY